MKNKKAWTLAVASLAGWLAGNGGMAATPAPPATEAELRACGHGREREIAGPAAREPGIVLTSITPADSSYVTANHMVVAELEYSIARFEPDMYQLNAQFESTDSHHTTGGWFQEFPELQYAHGAIRFCYPLRGIWSRPQVRFPLGMVFNLTRRMEDGSTQVIAQSAITHFNAIEVPAAAVNQPVPTLDQLATRDAVEKMYTLFESVGVHMQLCAEAFPAMKSSLMTPLQAWQKRYAKLQEKSDALYLDLMRQRIPGITNEGVMIAMEAWRTAIRQGIASEPQAVTQRNCALMPGRFADGTYDPDKRHPAEFKLVNALVSP